MGTGEVVVVKRAAWVLALLAGLAGVPFVDRPLSPDEGGFLLVASQWQPGQSLYGHYWVDRPPLLLTVFDLATHLGGTVALRLIGITAVTVSVLLAARLGRLGATRPTLVPAVVAGVFLSTPLFGTTEVDGELLAVPLVLAGLLALVRARDGSGVRSTAWAVAAGVAGASAVLVKQNVVDVFVAAAVLVVLLARTAGVRRAASYAVGVGAGGALAVAGGLVVSEVRGTEPVRLWDALVVFRGQAAEVIHASASSATSGRLVTLISALALSGAPLVVAVLLARLRGPAPSEEPDLRAPAVALLAWEVVAVALGGSYWLHYLIGLVPGLVLLTVAATQRGARLWRVTAGAVALAVVSCGVSVVGAAASTPVAARDAAVAAYLREHGTSHDTVVVGFGHPDIVYGAGMRSPYEELWSLPVRVRDPHLAELTAVLRGPHAPTWVVVSGGSLATWGVDATSAQRVLEARYQRATTLGSYVVWRWVTPGHEEPGRC